MPDRSKEELEQIYNDLSEFKKTLNWLNSFGDLWPTPMNGKTWEQEKNEFWNREINAFENLIREGNVKSCEIKSLCQTDIRYSRKRKDKEGFWNHVATHPYHSSEYPINDSFSLDQFMSILEKVLNDPGSTQEAEFVNKVLDGIGISACEVRASIENHELETDFTCIQDHNDKPQSKNYRT